MSVCCGLECVVALGCLRWGWKRCSYIGGYDSATWPIAEKEEYEPIPRVCRRVLAVYERDLDSPKHAPDCGYGVNSDWVIKRVSYEQTRGNAPPYLIYLDHDNQEIVLAMRGLNIVKESDYKVLLDNRLGRQMFDGGYVHCGLLKSAVWVLNEESETLRRLWEDNGRGYKMVFAGHSLGSGVAALMTAVAANNPDKLGVPRSLLRGYAIAPARCMSLNLAIKYADIIFSVVLQDDFLPRTSTPLEDIFKSVFCLPCLLLFVCLRDTFTSERRKLRDPRRLYAPGRMYHIVERKFCRCERFPPEVRTAIPVDGRFEHIVLSRNAISDHNIKCIERETRIALQGMQAEEAISAPPTAQHTLERQQTLDKEHKDAVNQALSLKIPYAENIAQEPSSSHGKSGIADALDVTLNTEDSCGKNPNTNWDELIEKLFTKTESGNLLFKADALGDHST